MHVCVCVCVCVCVWFTSCMHICSCMHVFITFENRHGFKLHKTASLLELFITKGRLLAVLWDQCQVSRPAVGGGPHVVKYNHGGQWDELVTTLVSLPTRMANCLGREVRYTMFIIIIIIIINLIYIAQFDTDSILTALYIVITYTIAICGRMNIHETIMFTHIFGAVN